MSKNESFITRNRKAYYDYRILEKFETGIELVGTEVKSIRAGHVNLKESFAKIINGEVFLINAHINVYSHGNLNNHEPNRDRKLLMHRKEIDKLSMKLNKKGLSLIPLSMYFKRQLVKVELAVGKGKKDYDRREDIKKRDIKRETERYDIKM